MTTVGVWRCRFVLYFMWFVGLYQEYINVDMVYLRIEIWCCYRPTMFGSWLICLTRARKLVLSCKQIGFSNSVVERLYYKHIMCTIGLLNRTKAELEDGLYCHTIQLRCKIMCQPIQTRDQKFASAMSYRFRRRDSNFMWTTLCTDKVVKIYYVHIYSTKKELR